MGKLYSEIVREERHFVAILFHLLFYRENMIRFLKYVEQVVSKQKIAGKKYRYKRGHENEANIYFEYAYLRDEWDEIFPAIDKKILSTGWSSAVKSNNKVKKNEIAEKLTKPNMDKIEVILKCLDVERNSKKYDVLKKILNDKDPIELPTGFNIFCPSRKNKEGGKKNESIHVENPGNWSLSKIMEKFPHENGNGQDRAELCVDICMLKWAFNANLDLVVAINEGSKSQVLIAIEAKIESSSSKYPPDNKSGEKDWFHKWVNCLDANSGINKTFFNLTKERKSKELIGLEQVGLQLYVLNKVSGGGPNYVVPLEFREEENKASWAKLFSTGEYVMKYPGQKDSGDEVLKHESRTITSAYERILEYTKSKEK